jgi:hypothetical protein
MKRASHEVECVDCGADIIAYVDDPEPRCDTDREHHAHFCGADCPVNPPHRAAAPDRMRTLTLDQATYWRNVGVCTEDEWRAYAHLWQTSAPRFDTRVCHCAECMAYYQAHP